MPRHLPAALAAGLGLLGLVLATAVFVAAPPPRLLAQPAPPGRPATEAEVAQARQAWAASRHANTFDNGLGANTTCASCKSPRNWDPGAPAAEAAHDCSACKREPGQPRPDLPGGVPVARADWQSIRCDVCHQPIGDSYSVALAYWNQQAGRYEAVANSTELCARCHAGQHGFEVVTEQAASPAHHGWECTRCHGSHNQPVACTDCHDPAAGRGAAVHGMHARGTPVNCTACHDAGGLPIWLDPYPTSRHFGEYAPQRVAHDVRSWPSHNLQNAVDCRRCHHPQGPLGAVVAANITCKTPGCHADGAGFNWCRVYPRDPVPELRDRP